ncbi:AP-1 complex subunit beta [Thraustotheca clavata]|uniref:AP-1 complex subunit beta n=1 Tax=Thraustotheca clavata TaxID=74557 RepID=A0A1V9Y4N3_9STRA|nr:AP-1 complex subunit beta [Thraustotheca clavata]
MKDLLRKFPHKVHDVLDVLPRIIPKVDDATAKCAVIWMLGEFGQDLRRAPYVLEKLIDSYGDEPAPAVLLELLSASLKLFFKRPPEMQSMLGRLLNAAINDTPNQDVRDRALFYYRLLSHDVNTAAQIVRQFQPEIVEVFAEMVETDLKEKLFREFNTLAVVYNKPSETFVAPSHMIAKVPVEDHEEEEEEEEEESYSDEDVQPVPTQQLVPPASMDPPAQSRQQSQASIDLLNMDFSAPIAQPQVAPFQLLPNPSMDAGTFQQLWGTLRIVAQIQLQMPGIPPQADIERAFGGHGILTMAAGDVGPQYKFFFYAQDTQGKYYLAETVVEKGPMVLHAVIKGQDDVGGQQFGEYFKRVLNTLYDEILLKCKNCIISSFTMDERKRRGDDDGRTRFTMTVQKKTKFDKEREQQERRKREEDAAAARVYESFVASFEDDGYKPFVKAGANVAPPAVKYTTPSPVQRQTSSIPSSQSTTKAFAFALDEDDEPAREVPKKKVREMDLFLQEIKESNFDPAPVEPTYQFSREERGSHDDGVGDTTNLYVGNLAPSISEESLKKIFEEYGAVYSVKIMWPRTDEERLRGRHCGFVCFRRREDADDARIHLNERLIDGQEITVGWGKAVRMDPIKPAFNPSPFPRPSMTPSTPFMRPPPPTAFPPRPSFPGPRPMLPTLNVIPPRPFPPSATPPIHVQMPEDIDTLRYINRFAECVVILDKTNDAMKLRQDSRFAFLNDSNAPLYHYYKWKVISLRRGENDQRWSHDPVQGEPGGPFYLPPQPFQAPRSRSPSRSRSPKPVRRTHRHHRSVSPVRDTNTPKELMTGAQLAAARDKEEGRIRHQLDKDEYEDLCDLLEVVSLERASICNVMAFALDHSECAMDIVSILQKAFRIEYNDEGDIVSPTTAYIARLYVVSDILHNSTVPKKNASLYRTQFQECLPEVMEVLNHVNQTIVGRMSFNAMKEKVLAVLNAWETWSLFPPAYLVGLNATFLQKRDPNERGVDPQTFVGPDVLALSEERLKRKCKQAGLVSSGTKNDMYSRLHMLRKFTTVGNANKTQNNDDIDGVPMDDEPKENDVDGETIDEDLDGEPIDDNLDGEPLDDDLDGEPLDEDLDGEPLDENMDA